MTVIYQNYSLRQKCTTTTLNNHLSINKEMNTADAKAIAGLPNKTDNTCTITSTKVVDLFGQMEKTSQYHHADGVCFSG